MKLEQLQYTTLFYVLLFAFIISPFYGNATHIVGGELNYKCLGNDDYEISLTVFRDCFNGNPNAYFDDPASIGIFDINNQLINSLGQDGQLLIDLIEDDTLEPVLFDSCLVVPPDVCVHTTTYIDTLNLPFRIGGYQLAYQRCCRNQTIVNIVAPLATGATYYNYISEEALLGCNSSAVFNEWPPNYICVDEPIFFDHSATDIDGDSIVYRMCTPFLGADQNTPRPQPPFNPPYDSITWINPPYNVANMMGGIPLEIDPNTGLLTGTPNTIGQFVVGVCVEEYRNGILISTTKRDFQYNTGLCGKAVSSFFAPEVDCDGFSVDFTNQSDNATEFFWDFGDPNTTSDISVLSNPSYVYPDTGLYEIMLIADPNDLCSDTAYTTVSVQYPSLFVDFDMEIIDGCVFPAEIIFTDITYDTISTPVEWEWLFSDGTVTNEQNPIWIINDGGNYTATLTVTSENGCQFYTQQSLSVEVLNLNLRDTAAICSGDEVQLNVNSDLSYTYVWTPNMDIDDVNLPSPTVSPTSTTTYYVNVIDPSTGCDYNDSVTVVLPPDIIFDTNEDTIFCEAEIPLYVNGSQGLDYQWYEDISLDFPIQLGGEIEVVPGYEATYYVVATDIFGCSQMDSVKVGSRIVEASGNPVTVCFSDGFELSVENLNPNDTLLYNWQPEQIINTGQGTNQVIGYTEESVIMEVTLENQFGCVDTLDITVTVIDELEEIEVEAMPDSIYPGDSTVLIPNGNPNYQYEWSPEESLDNPTFFSPTASPLEETTYNVTITDGNGCFAVSQVTVYMKTFECEEPYLFIPNAFTPNGDNTNDIFYVRGNAVEEITMIIYNRWGEKVFETESLEDGWNGTYEGEELPPDVYGYYLRILCVGEEEFIKKGNVTLIR